MNSGTEAITVATEAASRERSSVLADTHVLIWYTTAPSMLSTTALRVMEDAVAAGQPIVIAAVSLIELGYVAEKRSDSIDAETLRELLASIQASDSPIAIAPVTVDVVLPQQHQHPGSRIRRRCLAPCPRSCSARRG